MSEIEVYLDDGPGETRGVVVRDGRFEHLLIERRDDVGAHRLGARVAGRVVETSPAMKGAFVDLGTGLPGFLPLRGGFRPGPGSRLEVEVTAEPRGGKGPVLAAVGSCDRPPALITPGPSVVEQLRSLAPDAQPITGAAAIQATMEAEEEARGRGGSYGDTGLDLAAERTRALVAVDFDLAPRAGAPIARAQERANRQGLSETKRLLQLKRWGGLVVIDLIGAGHDGKSVLEWARRAFGDDPSVSYGPLSRFGLLQISLPWRRTPLEEVLNGPDGRRRLEHRAQDVVRALRLALLTDTRSPRLRARCEPGEAKAAAPLVAALGPRAELRPDAAIAPGAFVIEEG